MYYEKRNRENLDKLAPNTRRAALTWYSYCKSIGADILIYETIRSRETQRKNVAEGKSQTMQSYHLVGQALDFVPVNAKGETLWSGYSAPIIQKAIKEAKRLGFTWGGDWKSFVDMPHLQYDKIPYGQDKILKVIETPVKQVIKPLLTPPQSTLKLGTLVTKKEVHAYCKPEWGTQSGAIVKAGETRNVYSIQNGWYQLYSGEWLPSQSCKNFEYKPEKKSEAPVKTPVFRKEVMIDGKGETHTSIESVTKSVEGAMKQGAKTVTITDA